MNKKIEIIYLSPEELVKLPGNPRQYRDKEAFIKLTALIKEHGFQNPLNVYSENGKYTILVGNHRFDAGLSLGMTEFPCIVYEGDKKQALARSISDNRSSEWTEWDIPKLTELLVGLDLDETKQILTGFENNELKRMVDWPGTPEGVRYQDSKVKCPKCGHRFKPK